MCGDPRSGNGEGNGEWLWEESILADYIKGEWFIDTDYCVREG